MNFWLLAAVDVSAGVKSFKQGGRGEVISAISQKRNALRQRITAALIYLRRWNRQTNSSLAHSVYEQSREQNAATIQLHTWSLSLKQQKLLSTIERFWKNYCQGRGGRLAGKHGRELITPGKSGRGKILGDRLNLLGYTVVLQAQSIIWFIAHFLSYAGNYRVSATGSKYFYTATIVLWPQFFPQPRV